MADFRRTIMRGFALSAGVALLAGCSEGIDLDLRDIGGARLDTSEAARQPTQSRPRPDDRGIISYPSFQVAVARRGDTVADVAARVGQDPAELAAYNGIDPNTPLRAGEVIALPRRVETPSGAPSDQIDITALADNALNRAAAEGRERGTTQVAAAPPLSGPEPIQHQVERGETAYSIARLYNVSVRSLADWNGLGPDLTVREGQYLLIPVAKEPEPRTEARAETRAAPAPKPEVTVPGAGSVTPEPPSASRPLPEPEPEPKIAAPVIDKPKPAASSSGSGGGKLAMPVNGSIIRAYEKGKSDGIDIAASPGTPVRAAADGTVAAITRDTDGVPILVLRHADNLLTVYANIDDVQYEKGQKVRRGDTVAKVRAGTPSFLHFEVRRGFDSQDPMQFLN